MKVTRNNKRIPVITLLVVAFAFVTVNVSGQNKTKTEKVEEYVTIMVRHYDGKVSKIYITKSDGDYEEIKYDVTEQTKKYDLSPIIELLEKYDKAGWRLEDSNMTHAGEPGQELIYTYYILRRKRKVE